MNFKKLENNRPFAKIAFEGFAGDGKSRTATEVAIGIHKLIGSTKPVAIFDTEKAFKALKPIFDREGIEAVCDDESRSLASLSAAIKWCEQGNADILIIDSITHVWENYLQSYMEEKKRTRLEFQDWGVLKPKWKKEFSTPFVQATCHIIFTGRAGYEYETEVIKEEGKRDRKEIHKSGIKMKAETETAFEPDILVLMEKQMDLMSDIKTVWREATILKDRTDNIDGKTFKNPTFEDFFPAIKQLLDGVLKEQFLDQDIPDTFADWEGKYGDQSRRRNEAIAEIEGLFNLMGLGTSKEDKMIKAATLNKIFSVVSSEKLQSFSMPVSKLEKGLKIIHDFALKFKKYVSDCLDSETKVDMKEVGDLLTRSIEELTENAAL